jgi:hypothetical protein
VPRLTVRPEAELDALEAASWYEGEQNPFHACASGDSACIDAIADMLDPAGANPGHGCPQRVHQGEGDQPFGSTWPR